MFTTTIKSECGCELELTIGIRYDFTTHVYNPYRLINPCMQHSATIYNEATNLKKQFNPQTDTYQEERKI